MKLYSLASVAARRRVGGQITFHSLEDGSIIMISAMTRLCLDAQAPPNSGGAAMMVGGAAMMVGGAAMMVGGVQ